jgi:membrane-associated phospholipid phosphatase
MGFFRLISFVFHPLLFSFLGTFLYLLLSPKHVAKQQEYIILTIIFISTYILPIFLLMILKKLKVIDSYYLKTIEERKFPTIFFIILSIMIGKMLLNINLVDLLAYSFFGIALALTFSYLLFIKQIKTSLHTMGIGGLIGFILVMSYEYQLNFTIIISLLFILAGLIAVSRLKLHAHTSSEVYIGFMVGMITQFISYQFY